MKIFPTSTRILKAKRMFSTLVVSAVFVAAATGASTAFADRTYTTVVRETVYKSPSKVSVYHAPTRVIVSPRVIVPVSSSVYVGIGGGTYVAHQPRQTVIYREVTRHHNRHHDDYHRGNQYGRAKDYRDHPVWGYSSRGNAFGHRHKEPVRGRWSGSDRRRDVIYVERDGRRHSSYRETERRSVEIRDRSR